MTESKSQAMQPLGQTRQSKNTHPISRSAGGPFETEVGGFSTQLAFAAKAIIFRGMEMVD